MVRFTTVLVVGVISPMGSRSIRHISIKRNILNCICSIGLLFAASSSHSVYQDATRNFPWPSEPNIQNTFGMFQRNRKSGITHPNE